jgi:hypothetical protein
MSRHDMDDIIDMEIDEESRLDLTDDILRNNHE